MKKFVIDDSILRLISIMIGGFSIFLGYQLFIKGITGKASLVVNANTVGEQLLNAAPGLFFAIAGVVIVVFGLLRKETVMFSGKAADTIAAEKIKSLLEKVLEDASYSRADKTTMGAWSPPHRPRKACPRRPLQPFGWTMTMTA